MMCYTYHLVRMPHPTDWLHGYVAKANNGGVEKMLL